MQRNTHFSLIMQMLNASEWYGVSEFVEVAKGRNEIPKGIREGLYRAKRIAKWHAKKR